MHKHLKISCPHVLVLSSWSRFCPVVVVSCWVSALQKWLTSPCSGGLSPSPSNTGPTQRVSSWPVRLFFFFFYSFVNLNSLPALLSSGYAQLCSQLSSPTFMGADSFYVRVNLNMEPHGDSPSLSLSCDDIIHVTDTRYHGKYHWHCSVVDPNTVKPLQTGTMPNYNR